MRRRDVLGAVTLPAAERAAFIFGFHSGPRRPGHRIRLLAAFVWSILLSLAAVPAGAQSMARIHRLVVIGQTEASANGVRPGILPELERQGYVEGRNLDIRIGVGSVDALPAIVRDLLALRPDVLIVIGSAAARIAGAATTTVPIVMFGDDAVRLGLARSLARPGGNVTGISILGAALDGKRLELLREAVPAVRRVAALVRPSSPASSHAKQSMRDFAGAMGLEFRSFDADAPQDYVGAFAAMRDWQAQALIIVADPELSRDAKQLAALALEAGLPTICQWPERAMDGCLIGYGPRVREVFLQLGPFVARILKGSPPSAMPIEQPRRFDLIVNLSTARMLAIALPATILARADEVIE